MESSINHHSMNSCSVCSIMTRGKKAIGFCQKCKEYLCSSCEISHRFQKGRSAHEMIYGMPMTLRRNSFRPLTRCTTSEMKRQGKYQMVTHQRKRLAQQNKRITQQNKRMLQRLVSYLRFRFPASADYDTKYISDTNDANIVRKSQAMDDTDTSDSKCLRQSEDLAVNIECNKREINMTSTGQSHSNMVENFEMSNKCSQKLVSAMKVVSKREICIRFPGETYPPCINCCAFLPSGELVIGDKNNMTLKLLDTTLTPRDKIKLPGPPFHNIAVTSDTDVLICFRKVLQFVQILPNLELKHTIALENFCRGLAVKDGLIHVVESNEHKIRILDYYGQLLRYVTDNHGVALSFLKPVYLVMSDAGKLYVSELLERGVIHCFASDGSTLYMYEDAEVIYGACIYVDGDDNIILFGHKKGKVYVINKRGKNLGPILTDIDGLYVPKCMCFRPADNAFVLGGDIEKLLVYMLE